MIAKRLSAKDPSWFRQTTDRGDKSPAFQRTQQESSDLAEYAGSSVKQQLYGLAQNSEAPKSHGGSEDKGRPISSASTSPLGTVRLSQDNPTNPTSIDANSSFTSISDGSNIGRKSPLFSEGPQLLKPLTAQRESLEAQARRQEGLSPLKHERSPSPTKGMGGFVQSAMMRRSDSINKRWNSQPNNGPSRQNSKTSRHGDRKQLEEPQSYHPSIESGQKVDEETTTISRETSKDTQSRPISNNSIQSQMQNGDMSGGSLRRMHHQNSSRSQSDFAPPDSSGQEPQIAPSASNPSKRWSPTKSSWIESALAKPESPKPKSSSSQPTWMAELNKSRQERMSRDQPSRPVSEADIKPGSGIKSPPETVKTDPTKNAIDSHFEAPDTVPKPSRLSGEKSIAKSSQNPTTDRESVNGRASPSLSSKTESISSASSAEKKSKPDTPPKKDFRSSLKSRSESSKPQDSGSTEFQAAFGKLKRAETKNYVAPDELKDNILRGKAGLNTTGGPQKSIRRDEFKDSLIKQRDTMKLNVSENKPPSKPVKSPSVDEKVSPPEALAKRKMLGRSDRSGVASSEYGKESNKQKELPSTSALNHSGQIKIQEDSTLSNSQKIDRGSKLANRFNPSLVNIIARGPPADSKSLKDDQTGKESHSKESLSTSKAPVIDAAPLQHVTKGRARGPKRRPPKTQADTAGMVHALLRNEEQLSNLAEPSSLDLPSKQPTSPFSNLKPQSSTMTHIGSLDKLENPAQTSIKPGAEITSPLEASTQSEPGETSSRKPFMPPKSPRLSSRIDNRGLQEIPIERNEKSAAKDQAAEPRVSVKDFTASWTKRAKPDFENAAIAKKPIKLPTRSDEEAAHKKAGLIQDDGCPKTQRSPALPLTPKSTPQKDLEPMNPGESPRLNEQAQRMGVRRPTPTKPSTAVSKSPIVTAKAQERSPSSQTSDAKNRFGDFFDHPPQASGKLEVDPQAILNSKPPDSAKIKTLRKQINELTGDGKTSVLPANQDHVLFSESMYICTHVFGNEKGARLTEVYLWAGNGVPASTLEDAQVFARRLAKDVSGTLLIFRQAKEPANFFRALGGIIITRRGRNPQNSPPQPPGSFLLCGRRHLDHMTFDEVDFSLQSFHTAFPYIAVSHPSTSSQDQIYLWKGAGCNSEELGCARLISMDLGPSNEVIEIDEGAENPSFLSLFPPLSPEGTRHILPSASYWKLKATHNNFTLRLFQVERSLPGAPSSPHRRPPPSPNPRGNRSRSGSPSFWSLVGRRGSQPDSAPSASTTTDITFTSPDGTQRITEYHPFCQADIEHSGRGGVYVLDAFFEMYVLLGPPPPLPPPARPGRGGKRSAEEAGAFALAVLFAQEYGILASSLQDRPFVPVGTVVLGGNVSRDLAACFRAWDWGRREGLEREGGLKVVPLGAAVAAVREEVR